MNDAYPGNLSYKKLNFIISICEFLPRYKKKGRRTFVQRPFTDLYTTFEVFYSALKVKRLNATTVKSLFTDFK